MKEKLLVIDVGGTNIKYSTWNGQLGEVKEIPTPTDTMENFLSVLSYIIEEVGPIDGIAFSYPGFIDNKTGIKHGGGNLRYTDNISLIDLIKDNFNLKAAVDNDSKCATLAEMKYGALKEYQNACTLILGTGVGGTVMINREILRGSHLVAGEFSFIKTKIDEPEKFENIAASYCSSLGLSDCIYQTTGIKGLNGREIFKLIDEGNKEAYQGLKLFCENLSFLIYNLEVIVDPEVFIIGGGISAQPLLIETLKETLKEYYQEKSFGVEVPKIEVCQFRNNANLIGAAINYQNYYDQN